MQKTALSKAVVVALATLGAGAAMAQSSVTLYGNIDVAVDSVHKGQGDISGTLFQTLPAAVSSTALATAYNAAYANKATLTRVSPSISSQNAIGVKGVEDIGGGFKASFVLEGQMSPDNGAQSGQDSRMWGRQAFVGLTTPYGEVRLGRQYAPMFYSYAFTTVEALGAADMQALGLAANNLQIRQDNQMSYWLKSGDLTAVASYSPQAGVDSTINTTRGTSTTTTSGQIIGGASAGTEATGAGGRGQTYGALVSYAVSPELQVNGAYHMNRYGNAKLNVAGVTSVTLFNLDKDTSVSLGTKYTSSSGLVVGANLYQTKFAMDNGADIKMTSLGLGVKQTIDQFAVGAQFGYAKFNNFTKGKDQALMLIGDYNFSKRSKLYIRAGMIKDSRGNLANTESSFQLAGGPVPLLGALGSTESPFFAGGGANIDATSRVLAIGIRHQF